MQIELNIYFGTVVTIVCCLPDSLEITWARVQSDGGGVCVEWTSMSAVFTICRTSTGTGSFQQSRDKIKNDKWSHHCCHCIMCTFFYDISCDIPTKPQRFTNVQYVKGQVHPKYISLTSFIQKKSNPFLIL